MVEVGGPVMREERFPLDPDSSLSVSKIAVSVAGGVGGGRGQRGEELDMHTKEILADKVNEENDVMQCWKSFAEGLRLLK